MKKTSKPIVFFGNEKLATGIAAVRPVIKDAVVVAGFKLEQVVTGKLSELRPHKARLAVLAAYGQIVPKSILDEFPLGIINVHPSLLPLYRGPTPIEQAMLDGASKTGVSIMCLSASMDEGPIYKQKTIHLNGHESKSELASKLQNLGGELIVEVLPAIANGKLKPRSQPHPNRATYSHLISKESGVINWRKPAEQIEREIRAYQGWPGSRTTLAGKEITITKAHLVDSSGESGKIKIDGKQLVIFCGKQAIAVEKLKPAGKTEMSAEAFIAGYKPLLLK